MPESALRLIKRSAEFRPRTEVSSVPRGRRGIYVLYHQRRQKGKILFDVVYVGLATLSMRRRLDSHLKRKPDLWTHFSVYEVWDNIRDEEIVELEGLFRHIYRKDTNANRLNIQKQFRKARK